MKSVETKPRGPPTAWKAKSRPNDKTKTTHTEWGAYVIDISIRSEWSIWESIWSVWIAHNWRRGGGLLGRVANLFCDNWMESEIWKLHGLFKVRGYNTKDHVVGVIFKSGLPPPERDLMRIKLAKPSSWKFCNWLLVYWRVTRRDFFKISCPRIAILIAWNG